MLRPTPSSLRRTAASAGTIAPRTRVIYSTALESFLAYAGEQINADTLTAWHAVMRSKHRAATATLYLRGMLWALKQWGIDNNVTCHIVDDIKPRRRRTPRCPAHTALTTEQLQRLRGSCSGEDLLDKRDLALLHLLVRHSFERQTIIDLTIDDVDGWTLYARGRGGAATAVKLQSDTFTALHDWIAEVKRAHKRARLPSHALFWALTRASLDGVRSWRAPLTADGIYKTFRTRAIAVGLDPKQVTPRSLNRSRSAWE